LFFEESRTMTAASTPCVPRLTTPEAAHYLRLKPSTLAQWRYFGRGPRYIKLGSKVQYFQSDLDDWLEQQTKGGAED
jgi:predicted DNA-binding transcriptional regulator AlpA